MAPDNASQATPSKPQLLCFITALFIVKSKTANISVRGIHFNHSTDLTSHLMILFRLPFTATLMDNARSANRYFNGHPQSCRCSGVLERRAQKIRGDGDGATGQGL